MKLESVGILIGMRPLNERDSLATIFTADYGLMRGVMRAAQVAKKNRPLIGQMGAVSWNARLDSQLGTFHWEGSKNLAATLMMNPDGLALMNAAFELLSALLPEREKFYELYGTTIEMLPGLAMADARETYLRWEIALLRDAGYALDLTRCSGCGATESLNYMSPRTGRAVCDACAAPYIGRLYELPISLDITMKFLADACAQQGAQMPNARNFIMRKN